MGTFGEGVMKDVFSKLAHATKRTWKTYPTSIRTGIVCKTMLRVALIDSEPMSLQRIKWRFLADIINN